MPKKKKRGDLTGKQEQRLIKITVFSIVTAVTAIIITFMKDSYVLDILVELFGRILITIYYAGRLLIVSIFGKADMYLPEIENAEGAGTLSLSTIVGMITTMLRERLGALIRALAQKGWSL